MAGSGHRPGPWLEALPGFVTVTFVFDMFDLGQPNLVLLALMLYGFWLLRDRRGWMAGSMFALATAIKVFVGNDPVREFDRVPRFTPTQAELDAFTGTYYSEELDVRYTVRRKDSTLSVNLRRRGKLDLRPTFPDAFSVGGLGTIRFVREKGKVTSFRVTQGRVRNVLFKKEG